MPRSVTCYSSDAIGFRVGARCALHRGQMIVDGVDDFFSRGIEFVALLGFDLLRLGLGIQLGTRFLSGSILLCATCSAARF